ncbi:glycosyltransferase [Bacillus licheniformis]|uniref:glycosyltransferase family protein n=1 Tax=Bacillus licheniformis TaxID=1402 RepID=UPI00018C90FD|nr:glycosyltransferase [Bacillus licheniformis]MBU8741300.1 glycosyltransferase [Bacillus licheniformis]MCA1183683.1 glycosyltransferase [Bacillus licheniformis]MCM3212624.1 glycosyltransferase [Bacillus licheniformis]MCM3288033.1 glycosyltransferase [Bacillus licheniformis]MCY7743583.1 glycosyltransferase [Bacillus licheniformis]
MRRCLKILVLIKTFWKTMPKHEVKYKMMKSLEEFAEVMYWHTDGYLPDILDKIQFRPDFIFHYDIAYGFSLSPNIRGLKDTNIPTGAFVIDSHFNKQIRSSYFEDNQIDLIFSVTKEHFLNEYPQYKDKFRWVPWAVDPEIFKDWKLKKTIDYLLMGLVHEGNKRYPPKGKYLFREAVLQTMKHEEGFVHHPHPGNVITDEEEIKQAFLNEKYAQELNRAKIFFTCGSALRYPLLKFFEAPACRTLLLAEPNQDIFDLGFKDGTHFIACEVEDFYDKAKYYLQNKKERQRITDNGYRLVHSQHTYHARAQEIVDTIIDFLEQQEQ